MPDKTDTVVTRPSGRELEAALQTARTARFHMWKLANAAAGREFESLDQAEDWIDDQLDR